MSDNDERYGNALNLTPEQARNRRERREAGNARARANRLARENEQLRATPSPAVPAGLDEAWLAKEIDHHFNPYAETPCRCLGWSPLGRGQSRGVRDDSFARHIAAEVVAALTRALTEPEEKS